MKKRKRKASLQHQKKKPVLKINDNRKRLEGLEISIAGLEDEIKSIKIAMNDISKAADYVFLQETGIKLLEKEAALEGLYESWQELAER